MSRLVVALGVALMTGAAPAHADPGIDASFIDSLNRAGISFNDPTNAVEAAKTACGLMDQGKSQIDIVSLVMQQNSGITTVSAAKFTAIAASAYCPRYLQRGTGGAGGQ